MKTFTIVYKNENIAVEADDRYRLVFPGGKWLIIKKYPDDTQTVPVENENISYSTAFVWVVEDTSAGVDWLSKEALQEIGELARKQDQLLENG